MEMVDVYDDTFKKIGIKPKKEVHKTGEWHKAIHCWIVRRDNTGEYLLFQKRGKDKTLFPNYLDISAAGHYQTGEIVSDGVREITEELGLNVDFNKLLYLGIKFDINKSENIFNREFDEVFLHEESKSVYEYDIDIEEVEGLVQIKITDGINLFSNEIDFVMAEGVEWNQKNKIWEKVSIKVTKDMFIPRIDPYYAKMFMLAKWYFLGEQKLYI